MAKFVYIGNIISGHGKPPTTIETLGPLLEKEGHQVIYASDKRNKALRLFHMLVVVWKNRKKASFVLMDTYSTSNFYYAYLVGKLCCWLKLRYVPFLHGGGLENRLKGNPKMSRSLFQNAFEMVAPSKFLQSTFEQYGYNNVRHLPNSIKIEDYPFKERTSFNPKLLWVRSFAEIYNPVMAINVLVQLKERGIDTKLCMVGPDKDGSLQKVKEAAEHHKVSVIFTGRLSKPQWIELSQEYDIFVNTTNFDNAPVSVVEAMALGLPVVTTNVGGIPYLIKDGEEGFLIEANDATAMADVVEKILGDSTLTKEVTSQAREKVEHFDWEKVKYLWNELIDQCCTR